MHRKLSCRIQRKENKKSKKRGAVFLIFFLLLLLWTFPIRPNPYGPLFYISSADVFSEGKTRFYSLLQEHLKDYSFSKEIRGLLFDPLRKYPLFDHLMSFYYYSADLQHRQGQNLDAGQLEFAQRILEISTQMAFEFIDDVHTIMSRDSNLHIKTLLQSTGIFTRRMRPIFRKYSNSFFRPLPLKTRTQRVLDYLDIRKIHRSVRGNNITLAIVDSGLDPSYKELKSQISKHRDFLWGANPLEELSRFPYDWGGHGTAVASVIYYTAPDVDLMISRFYDSTSMSGVPISRWTAYLMAAGIIWAVENGADIINLSAALPTDIPVIRAAVRHCWDHNVILITAVGNDFGEPEGRLYYPAAYPWSIAVAGASKSKENWEVWEYSGKGAYIDVAAPSENLFAAAPTYLDKPSSLVRIEGNSYAAAAVSGFTALLLSSLDPAALKKLRSRPGTLTEFVRNIFHATASNQRLGYDRPNSMSGYGLIDVSKAISMARSLSNPGNFHSR